MDQRAQMLSPAGANPHKHQIIQSRLDFGASTGHRSGTGSYKLWLKTVGAAGSQQCELPDVELHSNVSSDPTT